MVASRLVVAVLVLPLVVVVLARAEVANRLAAGLLTVATAAIVPEALSPARTMTSTVSAVIGLLTGTGAAALFLLTETIVRCARVCLRRVHLSGNEEHSPNMK